MEHPGEASTPFQGCILFGTVNGTIGERFSLFLFFFIATTHTDNTATLHDYLSYATITTLHYTAKPTYRNCTYIAVILLN